MRGPRKIAGEYRATDVTELNRERTRINQRRFHDGYRARQFFEVEALLWIGQGPGTGLLGRVSDPQPAALSGSHHKASGYAGDSAETSEWLARCRPVTPTSDSPNSDEAEQSKWYSGETEV
jgi:hypothetical protein